MSSYMTTLLVALLPFTAFALPNPVPTSAICSKDGVFLQLAAPVIASSASKFCTTYIRSTITGTTTITQPATATATVTITTATVYQKREPAINFNLNLNLAALAPTPLLSSACSCLLVTASPPPTTVYPYTQTVTTTVATLTKTSDVIETCSAAALTSPIQNGDFSQGSTFWTVNTTGTAGCDGDFGGYCFNYYGFGVFFWADEPMNLTMYQTLVTCAGQRYQATITYKSEFCEGTSPGYAYTFNVDDQVLIDGTNQACGEASYPNLNGGPFHTQTANFTAQSNSPVFAVHINAVGNQAWEINNVTIAPI